MGRAAYDLSILYTGKFIVKDSYTSVLCRRREHLDGVFEGIYNIEAIVGQSDATTFKAGHLEDIADEGHEVSVG